MLFALDQTLNFPPVHLAEPDGLLAFGGDLSPERILRAYQLGIFPWYEDDVPLWWSPDPRFVLFPDELKLSKTVRQLLKRDAFQFTINKACAAVIHACKTVRRNGQDSTWITDAVETSYGKLHEAGWVHSAEVWLDDELVGGLYGLRIGHVFCGESMFSKVSNASRYAFAKYVSHLRNEGVTLIDCQVETEYLASMGARGIPREEFLRILNNDQTEGPYIYG